MGKRDDEINSHSQDVVGYYRHTLVYPEFNTNIHIRRMPKGHLAHFCDPKTGRIVKVLTQAMVDEEAGIARRRPYHRPRIAEVGRITDGKA
jgi:hypothetical protein